MSWSFERVELAFSIGPVSCKQLSLAGDCHLDKRGHQRESGQAGLQCQEGASCPDPCPWKARTDSPHLAEAAQAASRSVPCPMTSRPPSFPSLSQANLEEDRKEKNEDAPGSLEHECGKTESEVEKSDSEASTKEEQAGACAGPCAPEAEVGPAGASPALRRLDGGLPGQLRVSSLACRSRSWSP